MKSRLIFIAIIFFVLCGTAGGQSLTSTQFPGSMDWKKIETERCILIFPEELEEKALAIAAMLDSLYPPVEASLNTEVSKWPVILNNTLTVTNGYVAAAPKRSHLFTLPVQGGFSGTADWLEFLWLHELRHIVQSEKMQRGFTAFAGLLAGEYGWSGMSHFALPGWFWEGDAVVIETQLSTSGRGRLPYFERPLRANLLGGLRWNYYKSGLGSYKDNVPNHYVMGYYLCTYIRREFGIDAFNRIMEISADFSFTPLILNIAVKNVTGQTVEALYEACLDDLTELWSGQMAESRITEASIIKAGKEGSFSSYYPLGINSENRTISALKTSPSHLNRLVEIDETGSETLLKSIAPLSNNISYNGTAYCWSEIKRDSRWGNMSWALIRVYNPETGEYRLVTDRSRYFMPALSPDGSMIAAVEYTEDLKSAVVVIDSDTGELLKHFPEPAEAVASELCWTEDGERIVYIRQHDWKESLRIIDLASRKNMQLTGASKTDISSPANGGNWIYYISSASGIENINAVSLTDGSVFEAVSRPFGAASPVFAGGKLLFADYSTAGYAIAEAPADPDNWLRGDEIVNNHVDYFEDIRGQEPYYGFAGAETRETEGNTRKAAHYVVEDYFPAAGIFNFHSTGLGITSGGSGVEIYLQANDVLNLSSNQVFAGYDPLEGKLLTGFRGAWAGFYPILLYGAELKIPLFDEGVSPGADLYGGAALPLNLGGGIFNHSLSVQSVFFLTVPQLNSPGIQTSLQSGLSWAYTKKRAKLDLQPRLGIAFDAQWLYSINPSAYYNYLLAGFDFYLPGIFENHGLNLMVEAGSNIGSPSTNLPSRVAPRGLNPGDYDPRMLLNSSINYSAPLLYPDLNLGGFIYIPRIFMNLFLDTAALMDEPVGILQTVGVEAAMEFHLFNSSVPLISGVSFIYNTQNGKMRIEDIVLELGFELN